jgi:hypothetical protein
MAATFAGENRRPTPDRVRIAFVRVHMETIYKIKAAIFAALPETATDLQRQDAERLN